MNLPTVRTELLIRRPVTEVYEAFIDPAITSKFWFSRGSARLVANTRVRWEWAMFGFSVEITVKALELHKQIVIEWPADGTTNTVEWGFAQREQFTLVSITERGFDPDDGELVGKVADSTGGFNLVLAGLKAYLEHGIELNLVADRFPDGVKGEEQ